MPRVVNADVRRQEVVDAVFRVIDREGLAQASLRNVATEAGLAVGSVRHYFDGHPELLAFAYQALLDSFGDRFLRHADRLRNASSATGRRRAVEDALCEFLPLDEVRRRETVVWLAFSTAARTDPTLQPYARQMADGTRKIVRKVLENMRQAGEVATQLDLSLETERLCALLDGMALTAIVSPNTLSGKKMLTVLRRHLSSLT